MCTYKVLAVSNRAMCADFFGQLEKISRAGVPIILREKDLTEREYETLAKRTMEICPGVILHTFSSVAKGLGVKRIHLPLPILRETDLAGFDAVGSSVHSAAEAVEAQRLGAKYITAGHVFATDCKRGAPPRGLDFLRGVCDAVSIPVYAIGGINPQNAGLAIEAGACGVCIMSGLMKCGDVDAYLKGLSK